jgi:hypothetical protein
MTSNTGPGPRILGSLQSAAGKGIVHIEEDEEVIEARRTSCLTRSGSAGLPSTARTPGS